MKIVVDTNIFVAAAITPTGYPRKVLDACLADVTLVMWPSLQQEIKEALSKPKVKQLHGLSDPKIDRFLRSWLLVAELVSEPKKIRVSPDPDDNKLFACAVEVDADYIVSGDKNNVLSIGEYKGVKTISPTDFVLDVLIVEQAA